MKKHWKTTVAGLIAIAAVIGAILVPERTTEFLALAGAAAGAGNVFSRDHDK